MKTVRAIQPSKPDRDARAPRAAARPCIKWAGGKAWAASYLAALLPAQIDTYYEPMIGGGALFFALAAGGRYRSAVVGDTNWELLTTYQAIRDCPDQVIELLGHYRNDRELFLQVRADDPTLLPAAAVAARMIFLNRVAYNGLFRVNKRGQFNVPFGRYTNPTICDEPNLRAVHAVLAKDVAFFAGDYALATRAVPGDAIYFDPPYLPVSKTANFTGYVPGGWKLADHERLAAHFAELARRGVAVVLSNSDTETTRALYRGYDIRRLEARRSINSAGAKCGSVGEIVVVANCPTTS